MNRTIAVVVAAVFVLGGCSAGQEAKKETAGASSTPAAVKSSEPTYVQCSDGQLREKCDTTAPAVEETTPPAEDPAVAKVGATEWFTYEDGVKVQVTKVARFKIGQYASGGEPGGSAVMVTITIRNGSKKAADLSLTTVSLAYGANGDQADQVFDSEHSVGSGFEGSATPGKAKTAKFAFAVPKGRQVLDIEVAPGFLDYESAHFEGAVK